MALEFLKKLLTNLTQGTKISLGANIKGIGNIAFGRNVSIPRGCLLNSTSGRIILGEGVSLSPMVVMESRGGEIRVGRGSSINHFCVLYGHGGLTIGEDCIIATKTTLIPANHVFSGLDRPIKEQGETRKGIKIGNGVWIGAGVTVLDGVTVGDGCVIGAGSVVTEDMPPYSVAVGVPARMIKKRRDNP